MPISPIVLQRRHAELGRIRTGHKGSRGEPVKLTTFRFTSPSERFIRDIATLYGGEAKAWDNGGKPEWEVYTERKSIPVVVVKGGMSQWMETWSGGGCTHRCDGVTDEMTGQECNPDDPKHKAAKPYTRLSVMLPELEAIGVWRLESHGWNAAAELPNAAELAAHVADMVKANLTLVERRTVKDGRTNRFVVPVLDLEVSQRRLLAIAEQMSGTAPQIEGSAPLQIAAAAVQMDEDEVTDAIADVTNLDELRVLWNQVASSGGMTESIKAALTERARELTPQTPEAGDAPLPVAPPVSGPTAERDALQMQVLMQAAERGLTSDEVLAELEQEFAQPVDDLTVEQLQQYLAKVAAA